MPEKQNGRYKNHCQHHHRNKPGHRSLLDSYRPLPAALVKNLQSVFRIEFTYASNAIEGNTLTQNETALVVEKGITIGGKSLREHLEAINHAHAVDYIEHLAQQSKNKLELSTILDIHRLILKGIDDQHAGQLRKIAVRIAGSSVTFPIAVKVPELMENYVRWLHTTKDHPVLVAADAHYKLVAIHPFVDGNGRTARLIMNLLLIQAGYPPA